MINSASRSTIEKLQQLIREFYPDDLEYQTYANDCLYEAIQPETLRSMLFHFHEPEVKSLLKQHQPLFKVIAGKVVTNQTYWEAV